jgi:hypothetical protein
MTATQPAISAHSAPSTRSRSCSTVTPMTAATTGSPTVTAGNDASRSPAWNADCCSTVPPPSAITSP